jgi:2-polyprenyl-6-methoxyphenol hydroxylase-like FAD-dependent oxidoreductase
MHELCEYNSSGSLIQNLDLRAANQRWKHPWHLVHRIGLHDELKTLATRSSGSGTPAKLHTLSKVVKIDPQQGTIRLEDGSTVSADVIICADGIHVGRYYIPSDR